MHAENGVEKETFQGLPAKTRNEEMFASARASECVGVWMDETPPNAGAFICRLGARGYRGNCSGWNPSMHFIVFSSTFRGASLSRLLGGGRRTAGAGTKE